MASDLNNGFSNNIHLVTIRTFGTRTDVYTDRPIDFDGDGNKEQVTIAHVSGHAGSSGGKVRVSVTTPTGVARSRVDQTNEIDGGIDISGSEYTESVG